MNLTRKQIKERHFAKVFGAATLIECRCGCGKELKNKDLYGRDKFYINGHNGRKYTNPKQYKVEWRTRNKEKLVDIQRQQRRDRKIILIQYKGGKCVSCNTVFDGRNSPIFDFHHLRDKKFPICSKLTDKSIENLKKEVDKCILLCSNCHRLKHHSP